MPNPLHLYRQILRTHRLLPRTIRFVGDQYVKSEFRSHRTVSDQKYLAPFFEQWTAYLALLREQTRPGAQEIGRHLGPEQIERLDDDKAEQLLELHRASQEPENPATIRPPKRK
ncbi:hypothetical protein IWW55_001437 [Coemansia sp. RSA 2706]|nr:hypothetical protein LPJ63_000360 [Coemansia sp. RSA 2711]KAJ1845310.1 hypothetical protein LPJ70_002557 [Coemansia sp. RSA 2708]KAJ2306476.1 hypothetical protein IWW55_001437 [Coemansia sp. RSA 2706]KAJ2310103.1 hypothetical protein IWW54_003369 [Coemansia sp. RSA 2705]KAJ2319964.1 hypothetical protein IWW52_001657 [Coemansia sp. RSA 2704]KAJ2368582.1 hypothetical protein H4S01_001510 [Coemansia sp. RSA 2610]KAJ2390544.1 hypothetical protein H4S02_001806 [Coemansia sp. RSA 2611]KAJ273787